MRLATPTFATEKDLQNWIVARLREVGVPCEAEVVTNKKLETRADIVTRTTVIECKKTLDRENIHQAYSQGILYRRHLGKRFLVLVGLPPAPDARQTAVNTANAIMDTDRNLAVCWVLDGLIIPVGYGRDCVLYRINPRDYSWTKWIALLLAGIGLAIFMEHRRNPVPNLLPPTPVPIQDSLIDPCNRC